MGNAEEWKILAAEAAEEKDPEKLLKIVEALTRALDEKGTHKTQPALSETEGAA
jgi:hypothetical protein